MTLPSLPTLLRAFLAALFLALALLLGALRVGAQAPSDQAPSANEAPAPESPSGRAEDTRQAAADHDAAAHDDGDDAASSRATSFRAVDGAITEDVPGGLMLVGAYGAIFALLLLFLWRQQSQLRDLDSRITSLRAEIERGASTKGNERG
ncbi:MAG: hypothetical protein KC593_03790 [Myxococcales bacterium]|nr:hypothetical protein [Myxococcales bacterium]MCB9629897.1 hypothetical protein [Sandaracinaceae bacterium]